MYMRGCYGETRRIENKFEIAGRSESFLGGVFDAEDNSKTKGKLYF